MNVLAFIEGGFGLIEKLIEAHRINEWAKLIFGFLISWFVAFNAAMGTALAAGQPAWTSFGIGQIAGASVIYALFQYNPRTKGIMIAVSNQASLDLSKFQAEEKK